ncbi:hypothetical protein GCM10011357_33020 [Lacimicrobium alkaliphilum]|uniref:Uncharacterized protein n=1 Tax=Lacimicrobium alkaliphilum TaxID=1526571 RepID=A0ABQ1RMI6_9ALTE|nr:hypothetical protein GCM10011357_33020 [Lacimicrobium alkaliphilum]
MACIYTSDTPLPQWELLVYPVAALPTHQEKGAIQIRPINQYYISAVCAHGVKFQEARII